ncbi:conserved hypothetical protein [Desulfonatronospira thiodismutans ASO3-1]|uniref:Uncharacterized protein n=1 Tax=Desulfonatronospira thiodismutans ASO3-1 TaxID=555779 RepID=D6SKC8_9BACT|nr:hypothetical protein [Desulfonatronospira thiodismutans]EFI36331.1 conserved hypothetical protein [Desulfonatronospira thiodismutans ASO3-1]
MPDNEQLRRLAKKYVWWKSPEQALQNKRHFLAALMTFGTLEDTYWLEQNITRDELTDVLKNPPIGIFTARAWHFWHYRLGLAGNENEIPEQPTRTWQKSVTP